MCNWVTNNISIKGNQLDRIRKHLVRYEDGIGDCFDFNTIIPMPKDLEIEKSSQSHDGFLLYIAKINPLINNIGTKEDKLSSGDFGKLMLKHFPEVMRNMPKYILKPSEIEEKKRKYKDNLDEVIDMGKTVLNNRIKYGAYDWYDWRIEHWGTKWNSNDVWINEKDDEIEIYFSTPWSPSIPVIEALAKMYPDLEIIYEWAEEQTGWYSGKYTYRDGILVEALDYESYSKEAYEMSFKYWGDEEQYRYNPETDNYEYIEEGEE